ncbi:MAG: hypothetical protein J6Y78_04295 [Paludibacteraceae bacterium]|nr:hypothetical protein [Paludibacteraceae bacterium]
MVAQIQKIEEYYQSDEDDDDIFYAPTRFEVDEQLVIVACLMLLEQRYRVLKSMTPQRIVDEIDEMVDALNIELTDTALNKIDATVKTYFDKLMADYSIPSKYVEQDTSMYDIIDESITTLCNQLKGEIKQKSMFFIDNLTKDTFNILPNFKRAVQKVIDTVGGNLIYSKEKSKRNVEEFVYGSDKLYYWLTANDDKVCGWCRMQESLPPRTLREMPLDHWNGRCEHEPVDYTYSSEYMLMLARGEYMDDINAFAPSDENMSQATGRIQAERRRR